jgi:hypothetical protein
LYLLISLPFSLLGLNDEQKARGKELLELRHKYCFTHLSKFYDGFLPSAVSSASCNDSTTLKYFQKSITDYFNLKSDVTTTIMQPALQPQKEQQLQQESRQLQTQAQQYPHEGFDTLFITDCIEERLQIQAIKLVRYYFSPVLHYIIPLMVFKIKLGEAIDFSNVVTWIMFDPLRGTKDEIGCVLFRVHEMQSGTLGASYCL